MKFHAIAFSLFLSTTVSMAQEPTHQGGAPEEMTLLKKESATTIDLGTTAKKKINKKRTSKTQNEPPVKKTDADAKE
jgi:hypothetical protein